MHKAQQPTETSQAKRYDEPRNVNLSIKYGDYLTYPEFLSLDNPLKTQYLTLMRYLGIKTPEVLAEVLGTSVANAQEIVKKCNFASLNRQSANITSTWKRAEKDALGNHKGEIRISLLNAIEAAKKNGTLLIEAVEKGIRDCILNYNLSLRNDIDHKLFNEVSKVATLCIPNSIIRKEEQTMNKKPQTIKDVIGKTPDQMDMNDVEPVMKNCPVEPRYSKAELFDKDYLDKLFKYFPHALNVLVVRHLLGIEKDSTAGLGAYMNSVDIKHESSRKDCYLYENMALIGWAHGGDIDEAMKYYYEKHPEECASSKELPEEKPETKKPEAPVAAEQPKTPAQEVNPVVKYDNLPTEQSVHTEDVTPEKDKEPKPHMVEKERKVDGRICVTGAKAEILEAMLYIQEHFAIEVQHISF